MLESEIVLGIKYNEMAYLRDEESRRVQGTHLEPLHSESQDMRIWVPS